ncbi:hypothetical protein MA16_Dca019343 [Dendrobium catenatum]|uniref:Uncharacterized protein n=2 Tax=Dendrobium catenatum TaxID=906689 RepID=A0A2I0WRZ1_9ASPA|nr:hypothetical protein MA16_Dca019343 [Dendrobium catenatum]
MITVEHTEENFVGLTACLKSNVATCSDSDDTVATPDQLRPHVARSVPLPLVCGTNEGSYGYGENNALEELAVEAVKRIERQLVDHGNGEIELSANYIVCTEDVLIAGVKMPGINSSDKVDSTQRSQTVRRNVTKVFKSNLKGLEEVVQKLVKVPAEVSPFLQVNLVSTIHIADKEYFDNLQKGLELYDCVLYETVASRENLENRSSGSTKSLKDSRFRSFSILGFIQREMARLLALDFQSDCLNYQADNWLHADLDFETFKMLQLEKGESLFTFARDMTLKSTKAFVQSTSLPDDLDPWRSKLLQVSRVLPMPLIGLLIIGSVCSAAENQVSEYSEIEALSRLSDIALHLLECKKQEQQRELYKASET